MINRAGQVWISPLGNFMLILESLPAKSKLDSIAEFHLVAWIYTDIEENYSTVKKYCAGNGFESNIDMKRVI
jgi:hypothetical protein